MTAKGIDLRIAGKQKKGSGYAMVLHIGTISTEKMHAHRNNNSLFKNNFTLYLNK